MTAGFFYLTLAPVGSSLAAPSTLTKVTSFGSAGSSAGQTKLPRGVALDEATGDVYVVDQVNQRVDKFEPWGQVILSFGKEVNETTKADVCTAESKNTCKAGVEGNGAGQFRNPQGIAVDNSSDSSQGDVYVVDASNKRVEKFGPGGEFILAFGKEVNETTKASICTQAEVESGDKCGAGKEGTGEDEFKWPGEGSFIAVGSTGTVYVGDENRVQEFKSTGEYEGEVKLAGVGQIRALAVDSSGNLYIKSSTPSTSGVRKYSATGEKLLEFVDPSSEFEVKTIAVNAAGDVYMDDEEEFEEKFHILEYGPGGGNEPLAESATFSEEIESTGIAASAGGTVYLSNLDNDKILIFGNFPEHGECPFCKPSVDTESVSDLGVTSAVLGAEINPDLLSTRYYIQYVEASRYKETAVNPYEEGGVVPAPPATVALGGGQADADQSASVTLQGLLPGTNYDFRFVAESKNSGPIYGADQQFTTFPANIFSGLPDGRIYEQVSLEQKSGNEAGVSSGTHLGAGYGVTSANGERFVYAQVGPSGSTSSGSDFYSVSSRDPAGWEAAAALPPGYGANAANLLGELPHTFLASANLDHFVFRTEGSFVKENPITENLQRSSGLYRTNGNSVEPEWLSEPAEWQSSGHHPASFELKPEPGETEANGTLALPPAGGSEDLSVVYFPYEGTLVPEDTSRAPNVVANGKGPRGFYEYREGTIRSAAELPSGAPGAPYSPYGALPAASGTEDEATSVFHTLDNIVSKDGSKVFFVSPDPGLGQNGKPFAEEADTPTELYVRETTGHGPDETHTSTLISRNELLGGAEAEKGAGAGEGAYGETAVVPVAASYVYAAPDGSRAFFASRDNLAKNTAEATPTGTGVKEYEFNFETKKLTWLSEFSEPAVAPFSQILAASEDGSKLIFENPETKKVELSSNGVVTEVTSFSKPTGPAFSAVAANDGAAFVLATNAVLPGALNAEGTGPANNGEGQQQIYRYEPASGSLLCLSCAPTGTVQSPTVSSSTGRVVADEGGRVFFTTAEKLLSRDVNGVDDVYEWEQAGLGSCPGGAAAGCLYLISSGTSPNPSFYLDNSQSGDDVFFTTSQGLVAGDTDESYDVYDARVNGGFPQQSPAAECAGNCQSAPGPLSLSTPLTTTVGPSGNLTPPVSVAEQKPQTKSKPKAKPLTRAQKLAKALNACRKDQSRKRRNLCEAQARKGYGAIPHTKKAESKRRNG